MMRLIIWNLQATWRGWHLLIGMTLFAFIGWSSASPVMAIADQNQLTANVWDAFFLSYAGPVFSAFSLVGGLRWFSPLFLFFYLYGNLVQNVTRQHDPIILLRIGSRLRWWFGKLIVLSILTGGYSLLGMMAVVGGALTRLPWQWSISDVAQAGLLWHLPDSLRVETLIGWTALLFSTTLFAMTALQNLLVVLSRNNMIGLVSIVVIGLLSWILGTTSSGLVRWLPGSQAMLLRHSFYDGRVPAFTLTWSLVYNAVLAGVVFGLGVRTIQRMDIS